MTSNNHTYPPRLTLTRRSLIQALGVTAASAALGQAWASSSLASRDQKMLTRPIPSSGESLPVIGLGTFRGFDVGPSDGVYKTLPEVLNSLFDKGGTLIDSSPMYGRAEQTTGELLSARTMHYPAFLATKVWIQGRAEGIAQMERSFQLLQTDRIDLMQIHNLLDWETHLPTLRRWKQEGRIRYIGISHYTSSAYRDVEAVIQSETLDFLQINYAMDDRAVESRILPLCAERGVAVICNRPFGGGGLIGRLQGRPLPAWSAEVGATSWAQLALKFLISNPAVTCVIPGTSNPKYMAENAMAGFGPLLSERQRSELLALIG